MGKSPTQLPSQANSFKYGSSNIKLTQKFQIIQKEETF